jgi:hypothetical protein
VSDDDDFGFDETPFLEPAPDEEAWGAYLTLAVERLESDGSTGLTNAQLAAVEAAVGAQLPFEVGLLLVMGVPAKEPWVDWRHDPEAIVADWNRRITASVLSAIEHEDYWWPGFGARPSEPATRLSVARAGVDALPATLPLHGNHAVLLEATLPAGTNDGNPVLSIVGIDIAPAGDDLAQWLGREFDVPLPMWPQPEGREFTFWSDIMGRPRRT